MRFLRKKSALERQWTLGPLLSPLSNSREYFSKVSCFLSTFMDLSLLVVPKQHLRLDSDFNETFLKHIFIRCSQKWYHACDLTGAAYPWAITSCPLCSTQSVLAHRLAFLPMPLRICQSRLVQQQVSMSENISHFVIEAYGGEKP